MNPEAEAVLSVFRAADRLRRSFTHTLSAYGLTLQQYNVLRILRGAGESLPTMEIRSRMMERAPGITRIADALVAKGLVERELPPSDRRQVLCRATSRGLDLLARLDAPMDATDRRAFTGISKSRLGALIDSLRTVQNNLDSD